MFNGRRIDLDVLASQAHAMWRLRASVMPHSASIDWLWRAVLLALFIAVIFFRNTLMNLRWSELPASLLPFAVVALAGWWLRSMNVHMTSARTPLASLPYQAAPFLQRVQLNVTASLTRAQAMLTALTLPHIHLDQREAMQTIALFAQRMSRNWLELRAFIEAALESAFVFTPAGCEWVISPVQALLRASAVMARAPQVIALRC